MIRMDLNENDLNAIVNNYKSGRDPERVDYVAFAKEVNKIFTLKDLEYDPTKKIEAYGITQVLDPEDVLNPEEEVKVDACLKRLGDIVKKRKLHVKPMFQAKVHKKL
jgi:hypothetical protein